MDNGDDFASVHSAAVLAVFSLDSVSTPIVDQLLAAGRLPNLAQIQRSGRRVDLTEELPGAAYPTLGKGFVDELFL